MIADKCRCCLLGKVNYMYIYKQNNTRHKLQTIFHSFILMHFLLNLISQANDLNPIRSGLFQTANDPGGGGGFKSPPPYDLKNQSSPYHTCTFYQVFQASSNWNFSKICDFDHFTAISK